MQYAQLNDARQMPMLGLGTYTLTGARGERIMLEALELGYRLLDTARMYGNEREVGRAVSKSGLSRGEIFVTSKLNAPCASYAGAKGCILQSLETLQMDYVDLMLVHEPYEGAEDMYAALEEAQARGLAKSIGISNFGLGRCTGFYDRVNILPAVNQLENHLRFQQEELVGWLSQRGTVVQAWSPFGAGRGNILSDPVLVETGRRHGKTAAQVALRFLVQRGIAVIPKASSRDRLRQNMEIFDFELNGEEMRTLRAMDRGHSLFSWSWI